MSSALEVKISWLNGFSLIPGKFYRQRQDSYLYFEITHLGKKVLNSLDQYNNESFLEAGEIFYFLGDVVIYNGELYIAVLYKDRKGFIYCGSDDPHCKEVTEEAGK